MSLGDRIIVMEKGRIAQAGTPQQIYHEPANAFVADFIGTMNRLERDGRELMFRPEHARLVEAGAHDVECTVISSFFLGDRTRLVLDAGDGTPVIVETTQRRTWPRGERVHLALDIPGQAP
jgi:ABC-type spermidine/putrescine transport systems, ATPase components